MTYRLLERFRRTFENGPYLHRNSTLGDQVAYELYEDLLALARSPKLVSRIRRKQWVLNVKNLPQGLKVRRGDGSFGELVPSVEPAVEAGFSVARGPTATTEIGAEVKILAKAMIKQIDRVVNDLGKAVGHFRKKEPNSICVAVVGVNYAERCTSYEGDRPWPTDGRKYKHPIQEAEDAERHLKERVASSFDEFVLLRYKAENTNPYAFEWVQEEGTRRDYGAAITRISKYYESRF